MAVQTMPHAEKPAEKIFDVGIDERLPYNQLLILGVQNVFGMTGMFVFPGILGRSFNLSPEHGPLHTSLLNRRPWNYPPEAAVRGRPQCQAGAVAARCLR